MNYLFEIIQLHDIISMIFYFSSYIKHNIQMSFNRKYKKTNNELINVHFLT